MIYHISIDGNWYFVQAENYAGWVEKKHIALCSKEELIEMVKDIKPQLLITMGAGDIDRFVPQLETLLDS